MGEIKLDNGILRNYKILDKFNLEARMCWVDCSIYLMFAQAHRTDRDLR